MLPASSNKLVHFVATLSMVSCKLMAIVSIARQTCNGTDLSGVLLAAASCCCVGDIFPPSWLVPPARQLRHNCLLMSWFSPFTQHCPCYPAQGVDEPPAELCLHKSTYDTCTLHLLLVMQLLECHRPKTFLMSLAFLDFSEHSDWKMRQKNMYYIVARFRPIFPCV